MIFEAAMACVPDVCVCVCVCVVMTVASNVTCVAVVRCDVFVCVCVFMARIMCVLMMMMLCVSRWTGLWSQMRVHAELMHSETVLQTAHRASHAYLLHSHKIT
jgi:hypothetical protein